MFNHQNTPEPAFPPLTPEQRDAILSAFAGITRTGGDRVGSNR